MLHSSSKLSQDVRKIWQAGVDAVLPSQLIATVVQVSGRTLQLADVSIDLSTVRRIVVIGAGKAAGGMAVALEHALGDEVLDSKQVTGWVNVPADCIVPTKRIHLHAGRPAGVNEPRPEGVAGTREILRLADSLEREDLCICLLAGGGSALLVAPAPPVTLEQKLFVTQQLSAAGANIIELNTVRRALSSVKGGGLAAACRAGRLVTLIISDVLGDSLESIASGPTSKNSTSATEALDVLIKFGLSDLPQAADVVRFLSDSTDQTKKPSKPGVADVVNVVIANNSTAVDAAGAIAEQLGYSHAMVSANQVEGTAEDIGLHLAQMTKRMLSEPGPDCLISGGEPVVRLVDEKVRGKGGRNQQLVLAALEELGDCRGLALLSGGTDGEDGPTDAAGAVIDEDVARQADAQGLAPKDFLIRNDAYRFFEATGGLLKTGPTHTNVCDLRVVAVNRNELSSPQIK